MSSGFLIYAGNEPKSMPARDLGDCRDNFCGAEFFALFSGIAINLYNKSAYHSGIFPSVVSAFTFFNNSAYSAVLSLMESAVLSLAVSAVLSEDVSEASELSLVSSALLSLDVLVSLR